MARPASITFTIALAFTAMLGACRSASHPDRGHLREVGDSAESLPASDWWIGRVLRAAWGRTTTINPADVQILAGKSAPEVVESALKDPRAIAGFYELSLYFLHFVAGRRTI